MVYLDEVEEVGKGARVEEGDVAGSEAHLRHLAHLGDLSDDEEGS